MLLGWKVKLAFALGFGAVVSLWGWGTLRYNAGWEDGRADLIATQREAAEHIRRRVRDADIGEGDADADLCWLADRLRLATPPAGCE